MIFRSPFFDRSTFSKAEGFSRAARPNSSKSFPLSENLQMRNKNWLDASIADLLRDHKVALVIQDLSRIPGPAELSKSFKLPLFRSVLLSGVGGGSDNFPFYFVFFPAASFLSVQGFSMKAVVTWITAVECRVVNLLPYPSLP